MNKSFLILTLSMLVVFVAAPSISAADSKSGKDANFWANEVIKGGYILHFRHGHRNRYTTSPRTPETDVTAFDAVSLYLGMKGENEDFGIMTCLTEEGKAEANLVGRAFDILNVKIGPVLSSPSCRARQTSYFAFGTEGRIVNSLLHRTSVMREQHAQFQIDLRNKIFATPIEKGENMILSGHVGTLSYSEEQHLLDVNEVGNTSDRDDIGFVVLEKTKDDRLIARYMFKHFSSFTREVLRLPLN